MLKTPIHMAATAPRPLAELCSAPDHTIGALDAKAKTPQAMCLEMDASMLEQLRACARRSKPVQVQFGRTPVCLPHLCFESADQPGASIRRAVSRAVQPPVHIPPRNISMRAGPCQQRLGLLGARQPQSGVGGRQQGLGEHGSRTGRAQEQYGEHPAGGGG
jgi:hypothetical protein